MTDPAQLYAEAVGHLGAGRFADAEECARKILATAGQHADTLNILGLAQLRGGKPERAIVAFKKALKANHKLVPVHLNMGLALAELGRREEAETSFKSALAIDDRSIDAHFQLGLLLQKRFRFAEASEHFQRALEIDEKHALTHGVMGEALLLQGRFDDAKRHLERAIALNPKLIGVYDNLGLVAENQGRSEEALQWFARALEEDPDFPGSHFNRAVTHLRRGDMAQGLAEYEWRWRTPKTKLSTPVRPFTQAAWSGEPLQGRSLLVWGEQGVGDEIRTAGLVADLAERGEKVVLECDKRLVALFQRSLPGVTVIERRDPPVKAATDPTIAFQCPAESLIRFVRPTLAEFPNRPRYLRADEGRTAGFRARFKKGADSPPVIGLSWGSYNPQLLSGKTTALADWAPILRKPDVQFVGLQYGDIRTECETVEKELGVSLSQLGDLDLIKDLDGLAALISACDLVITVSNTTAHLAGALGVPTWVLLPYGHFQPWYWFSGRADSPWYPSVRLYRQQKFGDWANVIARVAADMPTTAS
ncbi:MAG: tetratricopeptide repeat protein [Rhodospirillaceae bacterium]|nr:tetratricopeptide repeat protein [Rhodospirillaceae bacterium]